MIYKQLVLLAALSLAIGNPPTPRPVITQQQTQQPQQPTSYELISRALAAGQIDAETAHTYRVFAAFTDTRLPQQYRGDDSTVEEVPPSVEEVGALLQTFSVQTQTVLAPFFLSPVDPGSWLHLTTVSGELPAPSPEHDESAPHEGSDDDASFAMSHTTTFRTIQWHTVLAAGGKVKVWAQKQIAGDSAKAEGIARAITATIWPKLTGLFWEPLSDANTPNSGGGPELDMVLVRPNFSDQNAAHNSRMYGKAGGWGGLARSTDPAKCAAVPATILINSVHPLGSATAPGLLQTVAHELTHAITMRMPLQQPCRHYRWFTEATGKWSEHFVYEDADSEQPWAHDFFGRTARSLDEPTPGDLEKNGYAAYIFPFYLQLTRKERAIPAMWRAFATNDLRTGIDAGLKTQGTDLTKLFPEFAVRNLNLDPVDDYRKDDGVPGRPIFEVQQSVNLQPGTSLYEKAIPMGMPYLATKYAQFGFYSSVRTVTFDNTLVPIPYASVWIIEKIGGKWQTPAEFTAKSGKTWCRDNASEDLSELHIIFVNREWQDTTLKVDPGTRVPLLSAYPTGCSGWVGTSDMTNTIVSTGPDVKIVESVHTNMQFVLDSALMRPGRPHQYWKTAGGQITWHVQVTGDCSGAAQGVIAIPNVTGDHVATLTVWEENGTMHHSGTSGPWPGDIPRYTVRCPNESAEMTFMAALGFFVTDGDKDALAVDGKSFAGSFTGPQPVPWITTHHRYSFRCAGC